MKYRSKILLLGFSLILFTSFGMNQIKAIPPADGTLNIGAPTEFNGQTFNMYYDIVIAGGISVNFTNCVFKFLNTTTASKIDIQNFASVRFIGCDFEGKTAGTGYIDSKTDSNLFFSGCNFLDVGTPSFMAIDSESNFFVLKDSTLTGRYCGLDAPYSINPTYIIKNNKFNDSSYFSRDAISLWNTRNVLIKDNEFYGYATGIQVHNGGRNITVIYNDFKGQLSRCAQISLNLNLLPWQGLNFSYNDLNSSQTGLEISNSNHTILAFNNISSNWEGMVLFESENLQAHNNTLVQHEPYQSGYQVFSVEGLRDCILENNTYEDNGESRHQPMRFYRIGSFGVDNLTVEDNLLNGKECLIRVNEDDYSKIVDYSSKDNLGSLLIWNCTGITVKNLNLSNSGAINIDNCTDVVVNNATVENRIESFRFKKSDNCTIQGSNFIESKHPLLEAIQVLNAKNCSIKSSNFTGGDVNKKQNGIFVQNSVNFTMETVQFQNTRHCLSVGASNGSIIKNNSFICDRGIELWGNSYHNNATYNEFIKWDHSTYWAEMIYYDFAGENNLWNYNHWANYLNSNDTDPTDGIADDPYTAYTMNLKSVVDQYPLFVDSDNDQLDEFQEIYRFKTDPDDDDSDNDGLIDGEEVKKGADGYLTNPNNPDTDNDKISDSDEVNGVFGYVTNPTSQDSDGDYFSDYTEMIETGSDPTDPLDFPGEVLDDPDLNYKDRNEGESENTRGTIPGFSIYIVLPVFFVALIGFVLYKRRDFELLSNVGGNRK